MLKLDFDKIMQKSCSGVQVDESSLPNSVKRRTQANAFIDLVVDSSVLLQNVTTQRVDDCKGDFPKLDLTDIVSESASTVSCPTLSAPEERVVAYDLEKYRSVFDLPGSFLSCNIEGEGIENTLLDMFRKKIANETELAAIESDSSLASGDGQSRINNLLGANDGWLKLLCSCTPSCQVIDAAGAGPSMDLFFSMLRAIPTKYRARKSEYRWLVPSSVFDLWAREISDRETMLGDAAITDGSVPGPWGIRMFEVPLWPDNFTSGSNNDATVIALTPLSNLWYFVKSDFRVESERVPRCDKTEWTMHWWADFAIADADMPVIARDVRIGGTPFTGVVTCADEASGRNPCPAQ